MTAHVGFVERAQRGNGESVGVDEDHPIDVWKELGQQASQPHDLAHAHLRQPGWVNGVNEQLRAVRFEHGSEPLDAAVPFEAAFVDDVNRDGTVALVETRTDRHRAPRQIRGVDREGEMHGPLKEMTGGHRAAPCGEPRSGTAGCWRRPAHVPSANPSA